MIIFDLIRGMFMAFADSVPGVSGGTIAFVMGFYSQFIGSISALTSPKAPKKEALKFLIKIGIGWAIGMIISVLFISSVFESHIYQISSLFIGFILFSIPLIYKEEKTVISGHKSHLLFTALGIIVVALITYFNPVSGGGILSVKAGDFSFGLAVYAFIAGMIAISAMVLPGISGSTLLLIFGLYTTIIDSVKELLHFNFAPLPLMICFGLGVILGVLTMVRVINRLLETKRSQLIYLIFGLMIGSLYAVVMGPTTLEIPKAPMNFSNFSIIFFIIGAAVILCLEKLKDVVASN